MLGGLLAAIHSGVGGEEVTLSRSVDGFPGSPDGGGQRHMLARTQRLFHIIKGIAIHTIPRAICHLMGTQVQLHQQA